MTDPLLDDVDMMIDSLREVEAPGPIGYWFRQLADKLEEKRTHRNQLLDALCKIDEIIEEDRKHHRD